MHSSRELKPNPKIRIFAQNTETYRQLKFRKHKNTNTVSDFYKKNHLAGKGSNTEMLPVNSIHP